MSSEAIHIDKALCIRVADGDEHAFRQLFDIYRPKLYTYILRITESVELSEDTVHDVFLKIWTNREKLIDIDNLNSYLFRTAHNHAINGLRKMARQTLVSVELEKDYNYEIGNPDHLLVRKEIQQFIADAVSKLSPQQKAVFQMSREQGLKQEEIAQELGIAVNTVKKHLTEALKFLRREISNTYGPQAVAIFVLYHLS